MKINDLAHVKCVVKAAAGRELCAIIVRKAHATAETFEALVASALNDFPKQLSKSDINVKHYIASNEDFTHGIEFIVFQKEIPSSYKQVNCLPLSV